MPDRETWGFINTFAPWLSAIGTITAVVVSLYLARRSTRPDVRVSARIVKIIAQGQKVANAPEFLKIEAVNQAFREVVIQWITWQLKGIRPQAFVVVPPADPYSTKVPTKLHHGDQATFLFPTSTFQK